MKNKDGTGTKEFNKMLDQVLGFLNGKEAWISCSVLARAISILWLYIEYAGSKNVDEEFEELLNIIKRDKARKSAMIKQVDFPINQ